MTCWFAGRLRGRGGVRTVDDATPTSLDLSGQPDVRIDQDDKEIADPFEIGHQMRGEHDADALFGDDLHEALQKFTPGEWVEAATGSSRRSSSGRLAMANVKATWAR